MNEGGDRGNVKRKKNGTRKKEMVQARIYSKRKLNAIGGIKTASYTRNLHKNEGHRRGVSHLSLTSISAVGCHLYNYSSAITHS